MTNADLRSLIVGVEHVVPLAGVRELPYANLDNAASTPALKAVKAEVDRLLEWYASVHRGAGYKSQLASAWYEKARETVAEFAGADPDYHSVILTHNTTDAINRLAAKFPRDNDRSVVISHVEHHANDLPWRERGRVVRVPVSPAGEIDPDELERTLRREGGKARLVSVTGASNVTGTIQPIHELARVAHDHGIPIAIDAAQLAAHVPVEMSGTDERERIDFLMLSGHKMYAPFGGGALIGSREFFASREPSVRGGGAVKVVESNAVDWADPPERDEAGSPNVAGAVALAAAMRELRRIGADVLEDAEHRLTRHCLEGLAEIDGVTVYGLGAGELDRRLGVIAFNVEGVPHALVAAVLAHEHGIGVRNGCFCAQPFLTDMLGIDEEAAQRFRDAIRAGDHSHTPGAVRASFGLYNVEDEVDRLLEAVAAVAAGRFDRARYRVDPATGEYRPAGHVPLRDHELLFNGQPQLMKRARV
ncbi:MAG: putative cysteine desulfurase [Calditrichaeota bacterium]|nr:putative cysteine desulfurase [Calditrichota bacterium]